MGMVITLTLSTASAQEIAPLPLLEQCQVQQTNPQTATLVDQLINSEADEETLADLINRLGRTCDGGAVEPLVKMLGNKSTRVRIAAVEALGRSGDQQAIEPLTTLLPTENFDVRIAIIRSLLSLQFTLARGAVMNTLTAPLANSETGEKDMIVRARSILTFNQLNNTMYNRKAIGLLHTYMESGNPEIVKLAVETLTRLPQTRNGTREMIGLIKNSNIPMIRIWMCEWIGKLKLSEARSALENIASRDPNQQARAAATEALKKIGP